MEKLQETYSRNGLDYKLVKRTDKVAMYEQFMPDGLSVGFEVFLVKIQPEFKFPNGTINPEKEAFPGNEMFGKTAWAYTTFPFADARYNEILNGTLHPIYKENDEAFVPFDMTTTKVLGRGRGRPAKNPTEKIVKPTVERTPKQKFVWEGKEYNSRSEVARTLLMKDGSNKASVAKTLNMTIQTVHAVWKKM